MKKYLADILTLIRFILATALLILAFLGDASSLGAGFLLFVFGELTDAFDGTCATRWPFPKNKTPKYRKYAAKYDMLTDAFLSVAMILFFILRVNLPAGLIIGVGYSVLALVIDLIVYGKLFGHPDDFTPRSLSAKNFPLAKRIILARRMLYIALIVLIAAWTLYASNWNSVVKITTTIIALAVGIFLWFFLAQRRHNISRDAVSIEKALSKKHR